MMIVYLAILFFLLSDVGDCLQNGAPKGACRKLMPRHAWIKPQTSKSPFIIQAKLLGSRVIVYLSSPVGRKFEGFILQARMAEDTSKFVDGEFNVDQFTRTIDCFNTSKNTLTHVNRNLKFDIVTEWTPRVDYNRKIIFQASVAQRFNTFWTGITSNPVKLTNAPESIVTKEKLYSKCFKEEGCVGIPEGCVEQQICQVLLRYGKSIDCVRFILQGYLQKNAASYMAVALSKDAEMGSDSVIECIGDGMSLAARESWNEGRRNTRTKKLSMYASSLIDGVTTCFWYLPFWTTRYRQDYDFENRKYYILLATGDMTPDWKLKRHDKKWASEKALNLTEYSECEEDVCDATVETTSHDLKSEPTAVTAVSEMASPTNKVKSSCKIVPITSGASCLFNTCITAILFMMLFFTMKKLFDLIIYV